MIKWQDILPKLELTGMAYALASNCELKEIDENEVKLEISKIHEPMLSPKLADRLGEALCDYFNRPINLRIDIK